MEKVYSASAAASSRHPSDWGRAMAKAMGDLATQVRRDDPAPSHEELFGQSMGLHIAAQDDGVLITLTWKQDAA